MMGGMSDSRYLLADDDDYSRALNELIGAEGVLIYCGAGLSYPLTGLTWNHLILDMFENLRSELENNIVEFTESADAYDKVKERLSASSSTPRENATVVATYIESLAKASYCQLDYYDKLADLIGQSIYRRLAKIQGLLTEGRRHTGSLLFEHVISLVIYLLLKGTKVRIVTTNYDTYLEETLRSVMTILSKDMTMSGKDRTAEYSVKVYGSDRCPNFSRLNSTTVPIVYLHGRIVRNVESSASDSENIPFKQLVFSEKEYYNHQYMTAKIMATVAKEIDCTLIIGSSLNDPPLLEWLYKNSIIDTSSVTSDIGKNGAKQKGKHRTSILVVQAIEQDRYTSEPLTDEDRISIAQMTRTRCKTLGVDYFIPVRCFADLSYLIRDTIIGKSGSTGSGSPNELSATHRELTTWATDASARLDDEVRVRRIRDQLFENVEAVQDLISELVLNRLSETRRQFPLAVRLEYWVRGVSPHRGDPEYLVKVADSAGVFLDRRVRRSESFFRRFPSRSAALRSIQFDASELTTLNKLGQHDHASRWQAFYAAPVRSQVGNSGLSLPVTTGALVAAIQLEESEHRFISRKMRIEFAKVVAETARRIESGNMNRTECNAFVRLDRCFRNIAIRVRNNYDNKKTG